MYTKLTKVEKFEDGQEAIVCIHFGTPECQIHKHNGTSSCGTCPMFGAIINQLHYFEEIITAEGYNYK